MAGRTIDGPDRNYLTIDELVIEVGLSRRTLRRLQEKGIFPRPAKQAKGEKARWTWRQVVYWHLYVEMRPYLRRKKREKSPPDPRPGYGQPRPQGGPTSSRARRTPLREPEGEVE